MKTNLLKPVSTTLLIVVFALLFSNLNAQSISNIAVPTGAMSCTNTTITVDAVQNCINYVYNGTSQSVVGNTLFLNLDWSTNSPICFGALSFIQEDFIFPSLPAGVNSIEVRTFLDGNQQQIAVNSITVTSCCSSQASFTSNLTDKCTADPDTFMFTNTSTGAVSQEWYVNNVLASTAVDYSPYLTTSGVYNIKLKVTDGTCADSMTQAVNVFLSPDIDLGPDIQACVNTFETLNAGAGYANYVWSSTAANTPTVNIVSTDSYNVVVTSSDGCEGTDTINATFNPLPIVSLGNDTSICDNTNLILNAGSFNAYDWSTGDTTQTTDASAGGIFNIEVTDTNGCQNTDDITVTLLISPTVNLGADSVEICLGDSIILDAGTQNSYNWSTGDTSQMITAKSNQLYAVTVTNTNNCQASDDVYVDFFSSPMVSLGNDTSICFGDNISFDAGSFATYVWPDNSTMQTFDVDSNMYTLGNNTIAVSVTDTNGCQGSGMLILEVIDCDTAVGIHSLHFNEQVLVYPNPTIDFLLIETETTFKVLDVSIVDLSGKTLMTENFEDVNFLRLNTESLETGLYFLVLKSGKQMEVRKISKK